MPETANKRRMPLGSTQQFVLSVFPVDDVLTTREAVNRVLDEHGVPISAASARSALSRLRQRGLVDADSSGPGVRSEWWLTPEGVKAVSG